MRIAHCILLLLLSSHIIGMEQVNHNESQLKKDMLYHGALGHTQTVQTILSHGIDPNIQDEQNMSLLDYATLYGYSDMVNILLAHPQLITTDIAQDNNAPFNVAVHNNHCIIVESMLSKCNTIDCTQALCGAIKQKSLCMVRSLLTNKVMPHVLNKLFCLAAKIGDAPIMQLLLDNGADINYYSADGFNSLHLAALNNYPYITRMLINHNDLKVNTSLPSAGFLYEGGYTSLHIAVEADHILVVQELLTHPDIMVNAQTESGRSPLDLAKTDEMRNLLIAKGAESTEPQTDNCSIQ